MKKRITSLLLTLCLVSALMSFFTVPVAAQAGTLVVLGDSISTGYGLEGYITTPQPYASDSYVNILAEQMNLTTLNLASDGLDSSELLALVKGMPEDVAKTVANANVISITIGGNDLLGVFFTEISSALGLDLSSPTFSKDIQVMSAAAYKTNDTDTLAKINGALTSIAAKYPKVASAYTENLAQIILSLREKNPTASIVVQTIANPYKGIVGISTIIDAGVSTLNKIISGGAKTGDYFVVDVYKAFNNSTAELMNATNPATFLDPHPNKAGHTLIAKSITQLLVKDEAKAEEPKSEEPKAEKSKAEEPKVKELKVYSDVTEKNWYYPAVTAMIQGGVLSPAEGELFNGSTEVTKGEAIALITKALSLTVTIEQLKAAQLLPETFNESDKIMRQELFVLVYQVLNYQKVIPASISSEKKLSDFKDADLIVPEAQAAIEVIYNLGIIGGSGSDKLNPTGLTTKAELVQVVFNMMHSKGI